MNIETMKKENDEITDLFRSCLEHTEMEVRDGFWDELATSVSVVQRRRKLVFTRIAAVASVLLVLGVSSAAFWYFSPKDEIGQAFSQIAVTTGVGTLGNDAVLNTFAPVLAQPIAQKPHGRNSASPLWNTQEEEDDSVSVTFSMSFSFSSTTTTNTPRRTNENGTGYWQAGSNGAQASVSDEQKETKNVTAIARDAKPRKRSLKAAVGTALPADNGKFKMPVSASVTLEQPLGEKFSVEAGVQYSNLRSEGQNLHYIGVPVKVNYMLTSTRKFDWYASVGGVADKCIAGAPDNSGEPVQLAVMAGLGLNYRISDKVALFAEPGISYHFKTSSALETLRTERPTNLNLICGIRMTY